MTESDLRETLRYYYAAIEWGVDHQVGRILDALERKGIAENTIVIFTSDHGDFMGEYNMVRKGMFLYDALLHIPFIVWAPGRIKKGLKTDVLAQHVDIYPTLVDMTEGEIPEDIPGRSLKPFLNGGSDQDPDHAVIASAMYSDFPKEYWENPEPAFNPDSDVPFHTRVQNWSWKDEKKTVMARTREWKLIKNESRPTELYHMAGGYNERENVAEVPEFSAIRKSLEAKLDATWKW
jgi:arylsulfatase A-like enzyme